MSKKKTDYFSPEARAERRQARLNKISSISGAFAGVRASKFEADAKRITTQNAGVKAVELVRDVFDKYNLPAMPKLSYSGLRGGRTAANSSKLVDGVVTVHAAFRTSSNVQIGLDIPIEIVNGEMLEPSVIVHNGSPRIIAQSTFDDIVERNTHFENMPVREMYSQPIDQHLAKQLYKDRVRVPRRNPGMFSVQGARENLRAAINGTAMKAEWQKPWEQEAESEEVPEEASEKTAQVASVVLDDLSPTGQTEGGDGMYDDYIVSGTYNDIPFFGVVAQHSERPDMFIDIVEMQPPSLVDDADFAHELHSAFMQTRSTRMAQQISPATQPLPQLKVPYHPGYGYGGTQQSAPDPTRSIRPPPPVPTNTNTPSGLEPTVVNQQPQNTQQLGQIPQQLGQMSQQLGTISQQLQPKQAGKKPPAGLVPPAPKPPKSPKPVNTKPPKIKAPPDPNRLCAKCGHAPCVCPNKRKKKLKAEWRTIDASPTMQHGADMDFMAKVEAEIESMKSDGLGEIDIKQAVFTKYGPNVAKQIFSKGAQSSVPFGKLPLGSKFYIPHLGPSLVMTKVQDEWSPGKYEGPHEDQGYEYSFKGFFNAVTDLGHRWTWKPDELVIPVEFGPDDGTDMEFPVVLPSEDVIDPAPPTRQFMHSKSAQSQCISCGAQAEDDMCQDCVDQLAAVAYDTMMPSPHREKDEALSPIQLPDPQVVDPRKIKYMSNKKK